MGNRSNELFVNLRTHQGKKDSFLHAKYKLSLEVCQLLRDR